MNALSPGQGETEEKPVRRGSPWPTKYSILPLVESDRALEYAGTAGFAIYAVLHKLRFMAPHDTRSAFFCSEEQISKFVGMTPRRLRAHLHTLEENGLVKIAKPRGFEKVLHQASKITIIPVFTDSNKIGDRPDKASGPKRTKRPRESGHETPTKMSVITADDLYRICSDLASGLQSDMVGGGGVEDGDFSGVLAARRQLNRPTTTAKTPHR